MKITLVLLLLFTSYIGFGQNSLKAKMVDSDGKNLAFVSIVLKDQTDSTTKSTGTLTDENGIWQVILLNKHQYLLKCSLVGFEEYTQEIGNSGNTDLGVLILKKNIKNLDEVIVTAQKKIIERKIDRLVFNIENTIASAGGDAMDALKITPRLKIQNDQITMIGKGNVSVMIDDRIIPLAGPELVDYLKSIASDNIKSIEVITNPPAKYSAEGKGGIINIKLKKAKKNALNTTFNSTYQQSALTSASSGISVFFQKNKTTLSSQCNFSSNGNAPTGIGYIYYPNNIWEEANNVAKRNKIGALNIVAEYQFSSKIKNGLSVKWSNENQLSNEKNSSYIFNNKPIKIDSIILTNANKNNTKQPLSINYHLIVDFDTLGKKLSFDLDFFRYKSNTKRFYETNTFTEKKEISPNSFASADNNGYQNINNWSFSVDMEHPFKNGNWNYGAKISSIKSYSKFDFYNFQTKERVFDPNQSNQFDYLEQTGAIFISTEKEINAKWEIKVGLRVEKTLTEGYSFTLKDQNKNNYLQFFPTGYLSFKAKNNHSFSLNYGRRIVRPNFSLVNPFKAAYSPYSFSEGNPFLKPAYSNEIELGYNYGDWISTSVYYSQLTEGFEPVTIIDAIAKTSNIKPLNFIVNKMFGINQSITCNPSKWITSQIYMDIYWSNTNSKIPITLQKLNSWNGEFSFKNDFSLNQSKTILLHITYNYTTAGVDKLDRNTAFFQANAALRLLFWDKKLQLNMQVNDLFRSNKPTYTTFSNDIKSSFTTYNDDRHFRITAIYSFGNKIKTHKNRSKNEDEQNRSIQ